MDEASAPLDGVATKLIAEIDDWENTWYPVADATLGFAYPEVRDKLLLNLHLTSGPELLLTVGTLLDQLDELEQSPDEADQAAIALLSKRGLDPSQRAAAQALVDQGRSLDFDSAPCPTDVELQVAIAGLDNDQVPPFADQVALADVPVIENPGPDETVSPNAAGDFLLSWSADPDAAVEVWLDMNMDWDNAVLRCYPPATRSSLRLPQDWMSEYSWGWAELRVITLQNTWRVLPGVTLMIQARRATHQSNEFEIVGSSAGSSGRR